MSTQAALDFVEAINNHDVETILSLMTDDHLFIDAYGNRENKEEMKSGWPGYFAWFPDYHIEIFDVLAEGNVVALFGYASGTYRGQATASNAGQWRLPAAWRVVTDEEKVKIWQGYAESKIPFSLLDGADSKR